MSTTTLTFIRGNGTTLAIARNGGTVLATDLHTEDMNADDVLEANEDDGDASAPADNGDGVLDHGIDFTLSGRKCAIKLLLAKRQTETGGSRFVTFTVTGTAEARND